MDVKDHAWSVRKKYDKKSNIEGLILFVITIGFIFYMGMEIIQRPKLPYDGYWWTALGFHSDFFIGFLSGYLFMGCVVLLVVYENNKRKWKSAFLIDNSGDKELIRKLVGEALQKMQNHPSTL